MHGFLFLSLESCTSLNFTLRSVWIFERKIPPEIIGTILNLLRDVSPPHRMTAKDIRELEVQHRNNPGSTNDLKLKLLKASMLHLGWIYATQFDRKWRQVALGHGALWTHIDPDLLGEQWTSEMILRSKGSALSVHHDHMHHRRFHASELPQAHAGDALAVRGIEIVNYVYPFSGNAVSQLLGKPQPALERLTFHAAPTEQMGFTSMPSTDSLLGGHSGSLPRLSSVSLLNTIPPWSSPVFTASSITSLYIGFTPTRTGETRAAVESRASPFVEPLLMTLGSISHSLEQLELANCLSLELPGGATPRDSGDKPKHRVTLHSLQSLKVSCSTLNVFFHFESHLTVSNALRVLHIDASSLLPGKPELTYDRVLHLVQALCFPQATSTSAQVESLTQDPHSHTFNELLIRHVIPYEDYNSYKPVRAGPGTLFIRLGLDFFRFQRSVAPSGPTCACHHLPDIRLCLPLGTTSNGCIPPVCTRLLDILPINWAAIARLAVVGEYAFTIDGHERPKLAWSVPEADKLLERMHGLTTLACGSEIASTVLDALLKSHRHPRPLPLDRNAYDDFDAELTVRSRIRLPRLRDFYLFDPDFSDYSFTFSDLADPEDMAAWKLAHPRVCMGFAAGADMPNKLNQVIRERGELHIPIGTVCVVLSGNQYGDRRITRASNEKRVKKALNFGRVTRVVTKEVEPLRS